MQKKNTVEKRRKESKSFGEKIEKARKVIKSFPKIRCQKKKRQFIFNQFILGSGFLTFIFLLGRPPGKKSSNAPTSNPKATPSTQKKQSNKPISNSQVVCKRNSSKSTNEFSKSTDKNKNSAPPEKPAPKKRGNLI